MVRILVTKRNGTRQAVDVPVGTTLMAGLRDGGIDDIEGICGGYALCGTCHCYVDEANRARLPDRNDDEEVLLEGLLTVTGDSRLMCQITASEELDGLEVTVAPLGE